MRLQWQWADSVGAVRRALRSLIVYWRFSVTLAGTVAIVVGANAGLYSVAKAAFLDPLPFPSPDELVWLGSDAELGRRATEQSEPNGGLPELSRLAAFAAGEVSIALSGENSRLMATEVSPRFFETLGGAAAAGRLPGADEIRTKAHVAVVSQRCARSFFGGDTDAIGKAIRISDSIVTVIGVVPAGREFPQGSDIWTPLGTSGGALFKGSRILNTIGRLRNAELLHALVARVDNLLHRVERRRVVSIGSLHEHLARGSRERVRLLVLGGGLIWLVACINLMYLLMSWTAQKRRGIGIRKALGCGTAGVVRHMTLEVGLLYGFGACGAIAVAVLSAASLRTILPPSTFNIVNAKVDWDVALVTIAATVVAGCISSVVPLVLLSRADPMVVLSSSGSGPSVSVLSRIARYAIPIQLCLVTALAMGAVFVTESLVRLTRVDLGIRTQSRFVCDVSLPEAQASRSRESFSRLLVSSSAEPSFRNVGAVNYMPLVGLKTFALLVRPAESAMRGEPAEYRVVGGQYFRTLGIELMCGRTFDERDARSAAGTAIVTNTLAARLWHGERACGRQISVVGVGTMDVVGVVTDVRHRGPREDAEPEFYVPLAQRGSSFLTVVVETDVPLTAAMLRLRRAARDADPAIALGPGRPLAEVRDEMLQPWRSQVVVAASMSTLSVVLVCIGIYGVTAYEASRRRREFAVRVALGANPAQLLSPFLRSGLARCAIGTAAGVFCVRMLDKWLRPYLFATTVEGVWWSVSVPVLIAAVTLLTIAAPILKVSRGDVWPVLRSE